jgi:hypothetical protein
MVVTGVSFAVYGGTLVASLMIGVLRVSHYIGCLKGNVNKHNNLSYVINCLSLDGTQA